MRNKLTAFLITAIVLHTLSFFLDSCAQISAPTGGPKDTLAPVLVTATPQIKSVNVSDKKITLTFNEYIELQELQSNLLISPLPKKNPEISSNLKTITIKLKDSLLPNTTYSFDFGMAIKDINEGNVLNNFNYTFSTGNIIDSLELKGNVVLAENGKIDSSLIILLYQNSPDSSVNTKKPTYITRVDGNGNFTFKHLPADHFKVYALKDGDGNKWYNSSTELFAFNDTEINTVDKLKPISLFAYAEKKEAPTAPKTAEKKTTEKKLKYNNNLLNGKQDLLIPMELTFNNTLKVCNTDSIFLYDSTFKNLRSNITVDSTRKKITVTHTWEEVNLYYLLISKTALEDANGLTLSKTDTLRFFSKSIEEYGSLKLIFKNLDLTKHPMLQFMEGENIKWNFPLTTNEWSNKMMLPGDFEVRILYDENNNGQWDPGNYKKKLQPEHAITLPQKIAIKANWDNEREINL
jgi:hypothetical protein